MWLGLFFGHVTVSFSPRRGFRVPAAGGCEAPGARLRIEFRSGEGVNGISDRPKSCLKFSQVLSQPPILCDEFRPSKHSFGTVLKYLHSPHWERYQGLISMKNSLRYGLLFGAVIVAGAGVAMAQMGQPRQPTLPGEPPESSRGRFAERFLAEFDLNHDGKVPRAEFNKAVAQQFFAASHGAQTMSQDQFIAARTKDLRQHVNELFRRSDWNGDGKLSFDEFAAPQRARFEQLDRDATGIVSCSTRRGGDNAAPQPRGNADAFGGYTRRRSTGGSRGRGSFCADADLNRDGKVTRPELDTALHQQYQTATKGKAFMTADELYALELARYREIDARIFQRMNTSYTGKLTLQEYAASEAKFFARLDKNADGVITQDELSSRRRSGGNTRVVRSGR